MTDTTTATSERVPGYSWYALALLTLIYLLNFVDRTLIYVLFLPIKSEMHFSDLQLALLGTTSFVIFYTLLGVPFGLLADRTKRKYVIGAGLAIWSLFSGLTGFAQSFWAIFFCRLMVGVGEATLGPAALSLLSDYFPKRMRATVQSVYSTGIVIGGGLAFLFGGWIAQAMSWRWAFYLLGFPGVALALLVFALREPARGRTETVVTAPTDWRAVFASLPLWLLILGYAFLGLASNNLGIWGTTFFVRVHGFSLKTVGLVGGVLAICAGVPAMITTGFASDRLSRAVRGGRMTLTMWAAVISIPLWVGLLFANGVALIIVLNVLLYALAVMWVGPATADVHDIAGPNLRGFAIGIFFSVVNIMAYGIGSPLIGHLSDVLGAATNPQQMRLSLLVCPAACALSAILLWSARVVSGGARAVAPELSDPRPQS